jgi:glycerol uptake facilitator-like aquaporin
MMGSISKRILAEIFGTFLLISVILYSNGQVAVVAAGLLIAASLTGNISGGHLNPVVSLIAATKGDMQWISYRRSSAVSSRSGSQSQ